MTTPRFRQSLIRAVLSGLALFAAACQARAPAPPAKLRLPLIPQPASVEAGEGSFTLDAASVIRVPAENPEARRIGELLAGYLQQARGFRPLVETAEGATAHPAIVLALDGQAAAAEEGYELTVSTQQIRIAARTPAGLFYGTVTAWQLLTPDLPAKATVTVPAVHIVDQPRFSWRGLMLDVSRHYMPPEFIEQLLDWMALHKLNTFHWHLTDDQGWRLEIKKYPLLTQVGAWRQEPDGSGRYGGYYTQDQVREIVRYAAERYITVVPEIDMPGHMQAAIAAYPWLGSRGDHPSVSADWGVHPYLLNVDERTFGFVEDVLTEVMALFPSRYIHIGGDEAIKDQWQASPQVQQRMHELGVPNENALQGWFAQRLETFLQQHGRKLLGWDEIVDAGLPADATVMSWRGTKGAIAASRAGHDVVMSPYQSLYLDYQQGGGHDEPPGRPAPLITLKDVYQFQPVPAELDAAQAAHVIGLQANVWTEHIIDPAQVEHAVFPRLAAMAEVAWSPAASRDWPDFLQRLLPQLARYRALHIGYANSAFAVQIEAQPAPGGATVTLGNQTGFGEIHYSLDGREPDIASPRYQAALNVPLPVRVRAAAFADGRAIAPPTALDLDAAALLHRNSDQLAPCSDKLPLRLGGQVQPDGRQAVYRVDIMDPCWIYRAAPLDGISRIDVRVAPLPFNFQLGHDARNVVTHPMWSLYGELEIHLDGCSGPLLAALRLPKHSPGQPPQALSARLKPQSGSHDLCFLLAAPRDPLWALDSVQLSGNPPGQ